MPNDLQSKQIIKRFTLKNNKAIKLKTIFMGTSIFAKDILEALLEDNYNVVACFTQPDKKSGRDKEIKINTVKDLCANNNIKVFQPKKFDSENISAIKNLEPDLIVVAAYGKIIPESILEIPGFGVINVHASLLPELRGSSPIQNAILQGKKETGITIMLMDKGVDTGDILAQEKIAIDDTDIYPVLSDKLAALGKDLIVKTLPLWIERKIKPAKQDDFKATASQLIEREDGHVFWEDEAENIYNKYRAFRPWPGIFGFWENDGCLQRIKFLKIKIQKTDPEAKHNIGEIFELGDQIGVQTLKGVIILEEVQPEGRSPVSVKDIVNGYRNFIGSILK